MGRIRRVTAGALLFSTDYTTRRESEQFVCWGRERRGVCWQLAQSKHRIVARVCGSSENVSQKAFNFFPFRRPFFKYGILYAFAFELLANDRREYLLELFALIAAKHVELFTLHSTRGPGLPVLHSRTPF